MSKIEPLKKESNEKAKEGTELSNQKNIRTLIEKEIY